MQQDRDDSKLVWPAWLMQLVIIIAFLRLTATWWLVRTQNLDEITLFKTCQDKAIAKISPRIIIAQSQNVSPDTARDLVHKRWLNSAIRGITNSLVCIMQIIQAWEASPRVQDWLRSQLRISYTSTGHFTSLLYIILLCLHFYLWKRGVWYYFFGSI